MKIQEATQSFIFLTNDTQLFLFTTLEHFHALTDGKNSHETQPFKSMQTCWPVFRIWRQYQYI